MHLTPFDSITIGAGAAYGVTEKFDIEAELLDKWLFNLGAKYQWLGSPLYKTKKGEWNSAARAKINFTYHEKEETERTKTAGEITKKELEKTTGLLDLFLKAPGIILSGAVAGAIEAGANELAANLARGQKGFGFSAANSWGYMVKDWLAVYGGGQLIYQYMAYDFGQTGNFKFHFFGGGPFAGFQLQAGSPRHKAFLAGEGSVTGIQSLRGAEKAAALIPNVSASLGYLYSAQ